MLAQRDHAAFKGRIRDCLKTGEGALRNPFAIVEEVLREALYYDELSVERETAVAQQIPNFRTRQNARGFNAGSFGEEGSPEVRVHSLAAAVRIIGFPPGLMTRRISSMRFGWNECDGEP